jgi:hypothetical protein
MRRAREVQILDCYDCGWVGNRPEEAEGDTGWSNIPWTEYLCPECSASLGSWWTAVERLED